LRGLRVQARGGDGDRVALLHGQLLERAQRLRGRSTGVELRGVGARAGAGAHGLGYGRADGKRVELLAFTPVGRGVLFKRGGVGAHLPEAVGQAQVAQVVLGGVLVYWLTFVKCPLPQFSAFFPK
ncbi:MAG TPA: hypothetical protein VF598_08885, partial [Hymenobacter sp.]